MREYVTRAVVLDKAARKNGSGSGDADARYSFFTERFGKIAARATSSRKITSKLAGHLEPGTLAAVRIIEQHGTQVVDALKIARTRISFADLVALNNLLGEWEPDAALWNILGNALKRGFDGESFPWASVLAVLGWDPRAAACANCSRPPRYFFIPRQEFFCAGCADLETGGAISKSARNDLILI